MRAKGRKRRDCQGMHFCMEGKGLIKDPGMGHIETCEVVFVVLNHCLARKPHWD